MRKAFHETLDHIAEQLVEMTRLAGSAIDRASRALLEADRELAEVVITADHELDALRAELDAEVIDAMARQSPVATDLRILVTALQMSTDIERMGDLARHVAKVSRLRYPESAVPAVLQETFTEMASIAIALAAETGQIVARKDLQGAVRLDTMDNRMDELHKSVFGILRGETWTGSVEQAIDATLLSRYFERYADHAVSVARQVAYLVTGEWGREQLSYDA